MSASEFERVWRGSVRAKSSASWTRGTPGIPGRQCECRRGDDAFKAVRLGCCTLVIYLHSRPQTVGNFARRSGRMPDVVCRVAGNAALLWGGDRSPGVGCHSGQLLRGRAAVTAMSGASVAAAAQAGGRRAPGVRADRECPGIASQPPSAPRARRRNACSRRGRLMVPGPACRQVPPCRRRSPLRRSPVRVGCAYGRAARVSAERARRPHVSRSVFRPARIRQQAANSCRNAVYTVILHYRRADAVEGRGAAGPAGWPAVP